MTTISTIQGDTWDKIAKRAYNDEKMMDTLIAANPDQRLTVIFPAGAEIDAPDVETPVRSSPPPWRKS